MPGSDAEGRNAAMWGTMAGVMAERGIYEVEIERDEAGRVSAAIAFADSGITFIAVDRDENGFIERIRRIPHALEPPRKQTT